MLRNFNPIYFSSYYYLFIYFYKRKRWITEQCIDSTRVAQKDLKSTDKIERDKYINHKD